MAEILSQYPKINFVSSTLVQVVQELSLANTLEEITTVVKKAARKLAHADGATFVLKDEGQCSYVDEDAISPLWKGMKFPLKACISGWSMLHREQLTIKDIYVDERIPHDAYKPTFVKSLAMTPIRKNDPVGAIGTYWEREYTPSDEELEALQALADSASIAINNVNTLNRIQRHAENLEKINQRLSRYTWIVSHDLKEPIRNISLNLSFLETDLIESGKLSTSDTAYKYIKKIYSSITNSETLISDILTIAKVENYQQSLQPVDLESVFVDVLDLLKDSIHEKRCKIIRENLPTVRTDPALIARVFQNIISNSIKFQEAGETPEIKLSSKLQGSHWVISIEDNGIGIPENLHEKVFDFFSHIHNRADFPGSGVGLSVCKKIITDLGGKIWIESLPTRGCKVSFTLPRNVSETF